MMTLAEWCATAECPWSLGTARVYARRALLGRPGYRHFPFRQVRKGAPIFVDHLAMAKVLWRRGGGL